MSKIANVYGREVLDSRGNPTVEVEITLEDGTYISGSVIVAFEVKDKKRMQRCDDFSKAVSAINAYIYSHIKR